MKKGQSASPAPELLVVLPTAWTQSKLLFIAGIWSYAWTPNRCLLAKTLIR
ncbi:hypothetical protein MITS9509_01919 [Synechococcus sp. MIT S9509]|nr:hypothetical protein MITS9504_01718 [Synechococcus sp. MIT S9504]KZR91998.1 hypothetical protein MITS9509_01919 [Synechococcus sp. MIT S9509]